MEMLVISIITIIPSLFKIDLIVWKSVSTLKREYGNIKFKIDLIVWKFPSSISV